MNTTLAGTKVCSKTAGFTLLELLTVIAITAILATVAAPSMIDFIRNSRLTGDANDLLRALQAARSEAIKRQSTVTVCLSANPAAGAAATCSFGAGTGWIVFQDTTSNWQHEGAEPIFSTQTVSSGVTISGDNSAVVTYGPSGFLVPNSSGGQIPSQYIVLFDSRGNLQVGNNSTARTLSISNTGRPRVSKLYSDLTTACTATGNCT